MDLNTIWYFFLSHICKKTVKKYYRIVSHDIQESNWNSGYFFSHHPGPPSPWIQIWNKVGSLNANDYPLEVLDYDNSITPTIYHKDARNKFITYIYQNHRTSLWTSNMKRETAKLIGVCAFDNAKATLKYGTSECIIEKYVEFYGKPLFNIAESDEGGSCVKMLHKINGIMTRSTFCKRNKLLRK